MSVAALILELEAKGVRLTVTGSKLRVNAPQGTITPDLRMQLVEHKPELIALFSEPPSLDAPRELLAGWRGAARELGELAGYPRVALDPARSVGPGAAPWRLFIQRASIGELRIAVASFRELIAEYPSAEAGTTMEEKINREGLQR